MLKQHYEQQMPFTAVSMAAADVHIQEHAPQRPSNPDIASSCSVLSQSMQQQQQPEHTHSQQHVAMSSLVPDTNGIAPNGAPMSATTGPLHNTNGAVMQVEQQQPHGVVDAGLALIDSVLQQNGLTPAGSAHTTPLASPLDPQHAILAFNQQHPQQHEASPSFQEQIQQQQQPHPIIQDMINSAAPPPPTIEQQQQQHHTTMTSSSEYQPQPQPATHHEQMAAVAAVAAVAQAAQMNMSHAPPQPSILLGQQQPQHPHQGLDQNSQHSSCPAESSQGFDAAAAATVTQQQHPMHPPGMTPQQQQQQPALMATAGHPTQATTAAAAAAAVGMVMAPLAEQSFVAGTPTQQQVVNHDAATTMALIHYQKHSLQDDSVSVARKKLRRNTMSSYPVQTSKHTSQGPQQQQQQQQTTTTTTSASSDDAPVRRLTRLQQRQSLGTLQLPPPPSAAELWSKVQTAPGRGQTVDRAPLSAKEYESMSREELVQRLVELEHEKRWCSAGSSMQSSPAVSINGDTESSSSVVLRPSESSSVCRDVEPIMEEDEGDDCAEDEEDEGQVVCKWHNCGIKFDKLQHLIDHLGEAHVGSGKPTYCCEWENCPRNQKPFTKRHKMYNHLRTHTGERPYVCTKPGCEKRFSRPDSLTTHIKTHSNVRPFICPAEGCGKAYYHARSLKKHEKIHETPSEFRRYSGIAGTMPSAVSFLNNNDQQAATVNLQHHPMTLAPAPPSTTTTAITTSQQLSHPPPAFVSTEAFHVSVQQPPHLQDYTPVSASEQQPPPTSPPQALTATQQENNPPPPPPHPTTTAGF